ncbi:hypothetical protein [Lacrimispora indolis]|uniref:hypothetical protein n=1 Tax=Lacrimispora indolis TaxID=69825 RepID=UPI0004624B0F|nr:hypothetical protein [[Clostridium] methoxybenzovorans]
MEEGTCETCGNRCNSLCDECKFYDGVECHQQADECRECTRGQNWIPESYDFPECREKGGAMKVWNSKYDTDHEELEVKVSVMANELGLLNHEVINDLEDLKSQHEDWEVDILLDAVRKLYITN